MASDGDGLDWASVPLSDLTITPATYGVVQPGLGATDGVPMLRVNNFSGHTLDLSEVLRISPQIESKYSRTRITAGDVLITIVGSVGQVAVVPRELRGWNIARAVAMIRPKVPELSRWISFVLRSPLAQHQLGVAANTTVQTTINLKDLRVLQIPMPSDKIREAVCGILGALDDRIDLLRQTSATLEAIAQALFKSWFVDFDPVRAKAEGREPEGMDAATAALFPSEFEDSELGPIPSGWRAGTLGDATSVIDCLHAKKPELIEAGRPYLQLNCIRGDGLLDTRLAACISDVDYAKWTSRIEASAGDCVITNVGRVGAVAQIPAGFQAAIGRNMTGIRPNADLSPTFLIELLMSGFMRREIEHKTDAGTILSALNVKSIPTLRLVWPSREVLSRFDALCRPLRSSMEINLQRSSSLAELRDTLLPRLISGKLRLSEAETVVAEAMPKESIASQRERP